MSDLIETVASLTRLMDRDALEATIAQVLLELGRAEALVLWRLEDGEPRLVLALPDPIAPDAPAPPWIAQAMRDGGLRVRREGPIWYYLLPLDGVACAGSSVVLRAGAALSEDCLRLLAGLLCIYGNHLAVLDFSARDQLTGLFNRRTFDSGFGRLRRGAAMDPRRAHLAVADIDLFKRINDRFGHPYGDEVLVMVARLMGECFRDGDLCYRFGGEEFVLILRHTDPGGAQAALDRFRDAVSSFVFPQVGRVTISIGFTGIDPTDNGAAAFGRADQALYVAKGSGRDQVQCYEQLVASGRIRPVTAAAQEMELF